MEILASDFRYLEIVMIVYLLVIFTAPKDIRIERIVKITMFLHAFQNEDFMV